MNTKKHLSKNNLPRWWKTSYHSDFAGSVEILGALDELIKWCPCNYLNIILLALLVAKSLMIHS